MNRQKIIPKKLQPRQAYDGPCMLIKGLPSDGDARIINEVDLSDDGMYRVFFSHDDESNVFFPLIRNPTRLS